MICKSQNTIFKITQSKRFKDNFPSPVIYGNTQMFDRDPYTVIDENRFLFVKSEYAQGIHFVNEYQGSLHVYVDHLPDNIDLINQYAALGTRRNQEKDATFYVWKRGRKENAIEALMKDTNRTELFDGIRIINILRGRERFLFERDAQFDLRFEKTWRISLRSLYKEFGINQLKRWERQGMKLK